MLNTFKSFFYLSDGAIITGFVLFYVGVSLLIYWACCVSALKEKLRSFHGVVAPYILVPMTIFSLSSALLGVAVWDHFQSNARAVGAEAQAVEAYITLVNSIPMDGQQTLVNDAKSYVQSALATEWEMIAKERHPHDGTSVQLQKLISDTVAIAIQNKLPSFLQSALLQSVQGINNSRSSRLNMINDEPDSYRWLSIILLGVMVLVSVAMVHLDKPKPLLITLAVSTCSICIVLSLIGLAVNPFSGMLMISKTPLERVLER